MSPDVPVIPGRESEELAQWIRLEQVCGVGPETARKLLSAFGLPENIFSANFSSLNQVVSERVALALLAPIGDATRAPIDEALEWVARPGNAVLTLADKIYPAGLLEISDPPLILYIKGRLELLSRPASPSSAAAMPLPKAYPMRKNSRRPSVMQV